MIKQPAKLALSVAITVMVLFSTVKLYAYKDGDFQVWNTEIEELKINKETKMVVEEEFHWGGSTKGFYYQHYDLGFFYSLQEHLSVGAGYRHVLSKSSDKFLIENEPYLAAILSWDIAGFKFDDRSRLEYNHFDYKDDMAGTVINLP